MQARELSVEEAERPLGWRYPEPYATYDAEGPLGRDPGFFAVDDEDGELVGFGCTGGGGARSRRRGGARDGRRAGEFDVLVREATRRTDGAEYRPT